MSWRENYKSDSNKLAKLNELVQRKEENLSSSMSWEDRYTNYSNRLDKLEGLKKDKKESAFLFTLLCIGIWGVWFFIKAGNGAEVMPIFSLICGIAEVILSRIIFIDASEAIQMNWQQVDDYLERDDMLLACMQDPFSDMLQADEWREERAILCMLKFAAIANIIIVCGLAYHIWNTTRPF